MRYLLDTQALLWFLESNSALSARAYELITDPTHEQFVGRVSFFEAAIKLAIGKLTLKRGLSGLLHDTAAEGINVVPVLDRHLLRYEGFPLHPDHRDPFDRLLIATAAEENLAIISSDPKFCWYPGFVAVEW